MSLRFHWFLPTNGDGRDIVGGGAGVALLRGGAGTALVGSHVEVADRIEEYARLGLSEFILSGYPHLEEAYWFGEGVLPILRARGLWRHPAPDSLDDTLNVTPFAPTSGSPAPSVDRPQAERAGLTIHHPAMSERR